MHGTDDICKHNLTPKTRREEATRKRTYRENNTETHLKDRERQCGLTGPIWLGTGTGGWLLWAL
jgi:hypothetical protein